MVMSKTNLPITVNQELQDTFNTALLANIHLLTNPSSLSNAPSLTNPRLLTNPADA